MAWLNESETGLIIKNISEFNALLNLRFNTGKPDFEKIQVLNNQIRSYKKEFHKFYHHLYRARICILFCLRTQNIYSI